MTDAVFYAESAEDADELLREFGRPVTIRRTTEGAYDPETSQSAVVVTDEPAIALTIDYEIDEINGTDILRTDQRMLVSLFREDGAGQITAPEANDRVIAEGVTLEIVPPVKPLAPGGIPVLYELQVRA